MSIEEAVDIFIDEQKRNVEIEELRYEQLKLDVQIKRLVLEKLKSGDFDIKCSLA